jgi:YesN/AraC family two-component response regulator
MTATPHPHTFSILIVEDDSMVCLSVSRILAREFPGSRVYCADNGHNGLETFRSHTPEIVITDINMPVMDGIEMSREIKAIRPDTKFIVVTGHFDRQYLESFEAIGYVEYIVKPLEFNKLFAAVEKCLAGIRVDS